MNPEPGPLLILDLDETLITSAPRTVGFASDFDVGPYAVRRRPHLDAFLSRMEPYFRLAVWSSAGSEYVRQVAAEVFRGHREPAFVWSGERCVWRLDPETYERSPLKDLAKLKRRGWNLASMIMVDDTPEKLTRQYGNAVYVRSWTGDPADRELLLLAEYLPSLAGAADVRRIEKRYWRQVVATRMARLSGDAG